LATPSSPEITTAPKQSWRPRARRWSRCTSDGPLVTSAVRNSPLAIYDSSSTASANRRRASPLKRRYCAKAYPDDRFVGVAAGLEGSPPGFAADGEAVDLAEPVRGLDPWPIVAPHLGVGSPQLSCIQAAEPCRQGVAGPAHRPRNATVVQQSPVKIQQQRERAMHRGAIAGHGFCRRLTQAITSIHAMTVHDRAATVDPSLCRRRLVRGLAGRDAGSMLTSRSVQQGNHCAREEFLYELKAGPAGGLRPPSAGRPLAGQTQAAEASRRHDERPTDAIPRT
jgi:hypothetical protein